MKRIIGIICAAGSSSRFGLNQKKEYLPFPQTKTKIKKHHLESLVKPKNLNEVSVISECVFKFLQFPEIQNLVLLIPEGHRERVTEILRLDSRLDDVCISAREFSEDEKTCLLVHGGNTRQESVLNALNVLEKTHQGQDAVLIHDGARPFVSSRLIKTIIDKLSEYSAVVPGLAVVDTQKKVSDNFIVENLARNSLRSVQTPQGFDFDLIHTAHTIAKCEGYFSATDDSELVLHAFPEAKIWVVEGERKNKKITFQDDLPPAPPKKHKPKKQAKDKSKGHRTDKGKKFGLDIKIGFGYDLHRLKKGLPLMLGGVCIESDKGCLAHSDGDVLLHAIADALLGATGSGDIGELFPPSDPKYKDANSRALLQKAWEHCNRQATYTIQNIDCVCVIETPKLLPYRDKIRTSIAECLGLHESRVFVKAKTSEGVGPVGKGKAIEAYATVLVTRIGQTSQEPVQPRQ